LRIKSLKIKNFRNLEDTVIYPGEKKNIFSGNNAQGKSNIVEAMYFLSTTRSYRTMKNNELIKWGADWFLIQANTESRGMENEIKIFYSQKKKA